MRKLITVILLGSLLLSPGCRQSPYWNVSYGSKVIGDGAGGAIALYDVLKNANHGDFYVQRVNSDGRSLWGEKGVLIGSGHTRSSIFIHLKIASDGHSGAVITRADLSPDQKTYVYQITRVDSKGEIVWQKGIKGVDEMIGDGDGGGIVAGADGSTLFIIKIDSEGGFPWGGDGVLMNRRGYQDNTLQLTSDGAGGAIVIWKESEFRLGTTESIFGQRINSEGNLLWGREGTLLYSAPENTAVGVYCMTNDRSGGAVIAWHQWVVNETIQGYSSRAVLNDIYVQKVDTSGNILWQPNGVPLDITKVTGIMASPHAPLVVGAGSGGAIIAFQDSRNGSFGLYAQKIDSDGRIEWQPGGRKVLGIDSGSVFSLQMASDGLGGALISFAFRQADTAQQGVLVQKLDPDGNTAWLTDDIGLIGNDNLAAHFTSSDGQGGVIVAWGTRKDMFSSEKSYIQRIDSNGKLLWGDKGIRLNP